MKKTTMTRGEMLRAAQPCDIESGDALQIDFFNRKYTLEDVLGFREHPEAARFRLMSDAELAGLTEDIKKNGLREAIVLLWGRGQPLVLDGRNRRRACQLAGVRLRFRLIDKKDLAAAGGPVAYVVSANLHRRHLTTAEKKDVAARLLKEDPKRNDREVGRRTELDGKTVGGVRRELEGRAEIPHVDKRTDSKGREQPARKGRPPEAAPDTEPAPFTTPDAEPVPFLAPFTTPGRARVLCLDLANKAIQCLKQIPKNHASRGEAFQMVREWIEREEEG
jgi:hypothetical protein